MQVDVLQVLTTVNQSKLVQLRNTVGSIVPMVKWVWVVGDIVVILTNIGKNASENSVDDTAGTID